MTAQFPHCDSLVLHAPGECIHCDKYPEWQRERIAKDILFTGEPPSARTWPDPATERRPLDVINRWFGNTPKKATEHRPAELMHTFDYAFHHILGPVWVCSNCYEVRRSEEHGYTVLNHSELVPCSGGAVYVPQRG